MNNQIKSFDDWWNLVGNGLIDCPTKDSCKMAWLASERKSDNFYNEFMNQISLVLDDLYEKIFFLKSTILTLVILLIIIILSSVFHLF